MHFQEPINPQSTQVNILDRLRANPLDLGLFLERVGKKDSLPKVKSKASLQDAIKDGREAKGYFRQVFELAEKEKSIEDILYDKAEVRQMGVQTTDLPKDEARRVLLDSPQQRFIKELSSEALKWFEDHLDLLPPTRRDIIINRLMDQIEIISFDICAYNIDSKHTITVLTTLFACLGEVMEGVTGKIPDPEEKTNLSFGIAANIVANVFKKFQEDPNLDSSEISDLSYIAIHSLKSIYSYRVPQERQLEIEQRMRLGINT
ncbi:MAG: hypothetical protein KC414_05265, partial [Romboutsia sp.]|nr:hypothetical protein [Romboutsia sp.]